MKKQQYIYLIFSRTTNRIGEMIRVFTRYEYNHISLSLSDDLSQIYSFARLHYDTPFYGGFVCESANRFISDNGVAKIKICKIPICERKYRIAKNYIHKMLRDKEKYIYNLISAASSTFHRRIHIEQAYTCVEFVTSVLRRIGAPRSILISRFCSIKQLDTIYSDLAIYSGEFPKEGGSPSEFDGYMQKNAVYRRIRYTIYSNAVLFGRLCKHLLRKPIH